MSSTNKVILGIFLTMTFVVGFIFFLLTGDNSSTSSESDVDWLGTQGIILILILFFAIIAVVTAVVKKYR